MLFIETSWEFYLKNFYLIEKLRGKSQNQVAKIINRYVFSLLQLIKNAWKVRCLRLPQRLLNRFNLPAPVHFFKLN